MRNGQEVEEYPRIDLEDINEDELGEGVTSENEPLGAEDDLGNGGEVGRDRQFFEEGEVQAGDIQEELMEGFHWKPRRIWGMKMGLVETESKRKRSSRGDLEGGGSLLDDARE